MSVSTQETKQRRSNWDSFDCRNTIPTIALVLSDCLFCNLFMNKSLQWRKTIKSPACKEKWTLHKRKAACRQPRELPNAYNTLLNSCLLFEALGRFLSGGIILGSPLSCTDLFLSTITLPALSCAHPLPSLMPLLNWRQEYSYRLKPGSREVL
jgi:hypothetical protein